MKTFRVIYLPLGREDKEWLDVQSVSEDQAIKDFNYGTLISIREMEGDDD